MKNYFLLTLAIIGIMSLASCKKDWTCTCVTTDGNGDEIASNSYKIEGETRDEAKSTCEDGNSSLGGISTDCSIEVF